MKIIYMGAKLVYLIRNSQIILPSDAERKEEEYW